jgi:hypothetical protein
MWEGRMQEEGQPVPVNKGKSLPWELTTLPAAVLGGCVGLIVGRYVLGIQGHSDANFFVGVVVGLIANGLVMDSPPDVAIVAEHYRTTGGWISLAIAAVLVSWSSFGTYAYSKIFLDGVHPVWFISFMGFGALHSAFLKCWWESSFLMGGALWLRS